MSGVVSIVAVAIFCAIGWFFLRKHSQKTERLIREYESGKNSITIEAMPIQLGDVRRGFERYQWKLVEAVPAKDGAMIYRFVRAVGSAPDAHNLFKAWRGEDKALNEPTVKCNFQKKIKAIELREINDAQTY